MDRPDLDRQSHDSALDALVRINWWSGSAGILWPTIRAWAQTSSRPLRILDVATGAGDVPLRLWLKAKRLGIAVQIVGCDVSETALTHARQRAQAARAEVTFVQRDVLRDSLPDDFDVLTSSLFLHHLEEGDALRLLQAMGRSARRGVLINDLVRSRLGYALAWMGTRILSRSWVARIDGPRSVEGAFTAAEALTLAQQAGLEGANVRRCWPCRYLLSWNRAT